MQHSVSVRAPQQPSVRTRALRAAAGTSALRCPPRAASGRRLRAACSAAAAVEPVPVMVNGITGKMGFATAEAALQRGLRLLPVAFSGQSVTCVGERVDLQPFDDAAMKQLLLRYPVQPRSFGATLQHALGADFAAQGLVVVDYTHPSTVHTNAQFYARHAVPFVMGTTGGDRAKLEAEVTQARTYAVIAPQMGKQLVAFQAAFELIAAAYPGAFAGYKMSVTESHQSSKADTSGTAKALVASFQKLGPKFEVDEIVKVRDAEHQLKMGVPEAHLAGHAYHTYRLTSPDGLVNFEFQHNVCGRSIYAQGTVDAVAFIAARARERSAKTLFNMVDVLSAGMA